MIKINIKVLDDSKTIVDDSLCEFVLNAFYILL